jgi:peptidyl-prolyl cis-trans isomerase D
MALGFMRRHRRWLYAFLWVVILGFIVFYIPAFRSVDAGSPGEAVGIVEGVPITAGEFQRAYQQRRQMYERIYQGRIDASMLRSLGLEEQVFEGLVREKLLLAEARRLGLTVGDDELAKSLTTAPDLQENGRFMGAAELKRRLALAGQSLAEFEASRRDRLLAAKLQALVTAGVGVAPHEVEREFRRRNEQIKAEYVLVDSSRFQAEAQVAEQEIKARFDSRREAYKLPERRVLSYLLVDPEAQRARVALTDRDIENYYNERRDEFRQEEEACASHVLFKVKASPDAKEGHNDDEAKRLAQSALERLKQGADFAALAKKESEDKGSAPGGGDLGCFGRGRMMPEFENAAFSLAAGETSPEPVKSSAGYHLIRVLTRRDETFLPIAQVKDRIRQTLSSQRARALAEDQSQAVETALRQGRSLEDTAKAQGLVVQSSQPLARGETKPPLASAALVARAFELKRGEVERQQAFPLSSGGFAFIALADIQPARIPEFKEVQEQLKQELLQEKALERARVLAAELKTRAEKQGLDKAASGLSLQRKEMPALIGRGQPLGDLGSGAALEQAAFSLPEKTLSEPVRAASGYAVLRVLEKKPFDPQAFEREKMAVASSLQDNKREQFFQAYLGDVRQKARVERRPDVFRRLIG